VQKLEQVGAVPALEVYFAFEQGEIAAGNFGTASLAQRPQVEPYVVT
jgi:hypothetical protein